MNLEFGDGKMAQIQLSWLDPRKERRLTVVGSQRMVELDDAHPSEKLRIYDKGFTRPPEFTQFGEYLTVRQGDIHIPHLDMPEPLNVECRHFIECIQKRADAPLRRPRGAGGGARAGGRAALAGSARRPGRPVLSRYRVGTPTQT